MNYYQYQMAMQNGQGQGMLQFKIIDPSAQKEQAYKMAMDDESAPPPHLIKGHVRHLDAVMGAQ